MVLSPFVFEEQKAVKNYAGVECFDESSPCVLEQYSECVIRVSNDQHKYVPWLVCMDSKGETKANVRSCAMAHGIDYAAVSNCQKINGTAILRELVQHDVAIHSTPTVQINGKTVGGMFG